MKSLLKTPWFWLQVGWYTIGWFTLIFAIWFVAFFTPSVQVRSHIETIDREFVFTNYSYKTLWSDILCGKPTSSLVIFEDPHLVAVANVLDNSTGYGSGDERVRKWVATGTVPETLPRGVEITVHKRILYPCLGLTKQVDTDRHTFLNR